MKVSYKKKALKERTGETENEKDGPQLQNRFLNRS